MHLDHAHLTIGEGIGVLELHGEGERVEPLNATRPCRHGPAGCCLTPQRLSPTGYARLVFAPPEFLPDPLRSACLSQVGIGLMFLVNLRYQRVCMSHA